MINDRIETLILTNLVHNEPYARKVIPYLKLDYFEETIERKIFEHIADFIHSYNNLPTKEALLIQLNEDTGLTQDQFKEASKYIADIKYDDKKPVDPKWLLDCSETWCKDRALYVALTQAIQIADNKKGNLSKGSIPQLMADALAVSFDSQIGHNYLKDFEERYAFYHAKEKKLDCDIDYMNKITDGGFSAETLNVFMSGPGGGKTLLMCHMAASNLSAGRNVLYITLEMSDKRIGERIDANLMNVVLHDLHSLPKDIYTKKIAKISATTKGELIIKQYPTATANADNFRHLLNELKLKERFIPDVLYIDYLNICTSARLKTSSKTGTYDYVKTIAEEIRGLAVEHRLPIITATQVNRAGFKSSDVDLDNTSESFGVPATADFMAALIVTEELDALGQIMIKQLKNRYSDPGLHRRFVVGVDKTKMRVYNVDESAQQNLDGIEVTGKEVKKSIDDDDIPLFDKSRFGEGMKAEHNGSSRKSRKNKYAGIKL